MCLSKVLSVAASVAFVNTIASFAYGRDLPLPQPGCSNADALKALGLTDDSLQKILKSASNNPKYAELKKLVGLIEACKAVGENAALSPRRLPTANETGPISTPSTATPLPPKIVPATPTQSQVTSTSGQTQDTQFRFLLRQDFTDVSIIAAPDPLGGDKSKASGASIGYSNDTVADNKQWTAQGTAIAGYSFDRGFGPDSAVNLYAGTIGIYAGLNQQANSNAKLVAKNPALKDTDSRTAGVLTELGFDHIFGGDQWIRGRVGLVDDHLASTSAFAATVEWIPVYKNLLVHWPRFFTLPFSDSEVGLRFDPEFVVQYDQTSSSKKLLFSNDKEAFRVGPQLSLWLLSFVDISYLENININLTYHPYYETVSQRYLSWFKAAATYNLDASGTLGLTGSYQRGTDELTGKDTNIYKIVLSGKLDYCTAWCPLAKPQTSP